MQKLICPLMLICLGLGLTGCGERTSVNARSRDAGDSEESKISPEERKYLSAAQPFVNAVAARNYEQAFSLLSSHARARMSPGQFVPPDDDQQARRNEVNTLSNARKEDFASWMGKVEGQHGLPSAVQRLYVQSTDSMVLSGKGEALDSMFAIGGMPKSIPNEIRRASLRCQIATRLTPAQLKQAAKDYGVTVEELQKDADFAPYFTLKVVLVKEEGALRVGYFEFLPPSMLD